MLNPYRCENAKDLYWGDGRRTDAPDRLALDAVAALAREADVFLDVGAYTGLFTLATTAIAPDIVVHAFEIVPAVADALEANVRRNGIEDRVTVHREGIGEHGASILMPTGEGGSALPSFYSTNMRFENGEVVFLRSLDSVGELLSVGASVLMKIDVEGTEGAVFESGQRFLEGFRPEILCEVLLGKADGSRLDTLLRPAALRRYLVTSSSLVERKQIVPDRRFRDWLFSRRSPEQLRALGLPVTTAS
jgi:FkbM family methyltransferase